MGFSSIVNGVGGNTTLPEFIVQGWDNTATVQSPFPLSVPPDRCRVIPKVFVPDLKEQNQEISGATAILGAPLRMAIESGPDDRSIMWHNVLNFVCADDSNLTVSIEVNCHAVDDLPLQRHLWEWHLTLRKTP